jgi:hypothetical protein
MPVDETLENTMLYMIVGRDAEDSLSRRGAAREAHLARIRALMDEGRLVLAGPMPRIDAADPGPAGFAGSLIVAEFDSLEAAREWAGSDPYLSGGAWRETEVHPFKQVLP